MTTPAEQPQYPGQRPAPATPPPPPPAAYPPAAYAQQGATQAYAPYAAPPSQAGGGIQLAGGIWGIILLALGALLVLCGFIALLVVLIAENPYKSTLALNALLTPGLTLCGLFLGMQIWASVKAKGK
ncbi:MAG: hypothetical protein LBJ02_11075 [Bifidobacteriaceae bacterium]|jgi:hypothetical protein|nr:hypothetical protein [Bifidobacteriaceae bacterium]